MSRGLWIHAASAALAVLVAGGLRSGAAEDMTDNQKNLFVASHTYSKDWSELYRNVANGEGEVRVELEREDGKAIAGFSAQVCDPIKGAIDDYRVTWAGKGDITSLRGEHVQIKFILENASIFSYSLM
jgi:hypothetical protein